MSGPPKGDDVPMDRRGFFDRVAGGVYGAALASLLGQDLHGATELAAEGNPPVDLRPRSPHFEPKAKAVIHLFMNGGPSQMDLFDPKPALDRHHGEPLFDRIAGEVENLRDAGSLDAQSLQIRAAWRERHVGFRRFAASRSAGRQPGAHPFDVHDQSDARAGDLSGPVGQDGARASRAGVVGRFRVGFGEPEPASLRRARRSARPADQRSGELAIGLPAAGLPGHAVSSDGLAGPESPAGPSTLPRSKSGSSATCWHASIGSIRPTVPPSRTSRPGSPVISWPPRMQLAASDALDLSREGQETLALYGIGHEPTDSMAGAA